MRMGLLLILYLPSFNCHVSRWRRIDYKERTPELCGHLFRFNPLIKPLYVHPDNGERGLFMARAWGNRLKRWVTATMDLPEDIMMDLPRITMVGQLHIYIENHKGLLAFSDKELRLMLKNGQLLVKGEDFVLKTILPEEILLEGKIESVLFLEE